MFEYLNRIMKKEVCLFRVAFLVLMMAAGSAWGQKPLKPRPDAFPPVEGLQTKGVQMATSVEEMASWNRYPTYQTYLAMMQQWAADYPSLCTLDTIGLSIQGRLILAAHIEGSGEGEHPEFFYSSTIHGDELTGFVMMLRLIDTLLSSYGTNQRLTDLVNTTAIYINPLANPDGTYKRGDHTVQGSVRFNANSLDLNRNYPDPFGVTNYSIPQENQAMIDYFTAHSFRLSANLHGGSEVLNYPWDCFTSSQNPHPQADWWEEVCHRFVDTCRINSSSHFRDVTSSGVVPGGDWYVIHGGRQDYVNYYHNCLEVTMEISTEKTLSSDQLPEYWRFLSHSFINFIAEIHNLPEGVGVASADLPSNRIKVFPNPVTEHFFVEGVAESIPVELYDMQGRRALSVGACRGRAVSVRHLPKGIYLLRAGDAVGKVIKK